MNAALNYIYRNAEMLAAACLGAYVGSFWTLWDLVAFAMLIHGFRKRRDPWL